MEVKNCNKCGRIFNYFVGEQICPTCMRALDKEFDKVKDYIYENPGAGIQEVSAECDVSISQIKKWVREERLEFTEDSLVGIECESCGVSIRTGRFCNQCKNKLASELLSGNKKDNIEPEKKTRRSRNHKMRFLE